MSAETSAKTQQTEMKNVLSQYLHLFDADCNQFKSFMAANSAIDWFGRTIRGPVKIHDYLRNQVCNVYQHLDFDEVKICDAFEYKPTHMKTKTLISDDIDFVPPINKVTGITSLKLYADSDLEEEEDDDVDVDMHYLTPEKPLEDESLINSSAVITPPASTNKVVPTHGSDTETEEEENDDNDNVAAAADDDDDMPMTATAPKRRKRSHNATQQIFSSRRRPQSSALKRKQIKEIGVRALLFDAPSDSDNDDIDAATDAGKELEYSNLTYIQVVGNLRSLNSARQEDAANSTTTAAGRYCMDEATSANYWERPTRLLISFRRRFCDQQIQFALIIYEHADKLCAMLPKRNLMLEFQQLKANKDGRDEEEEDDKEEEEEDSDVVAGKHSQNTHSLLQTELLSDIPPTTSSSILTTPTKYNNTPPPTPTRKPRLPPTLSSLKRTQKCPTTRTTATSIATTPASAATTNITAATPTSAKRNVVRSLRL